MDQLVPLISSTVCGPLGIVHLPRLWLKASLAEVGALYDGWIGEDRGFNKRLLDAFGIDIPAFYAFIATLPSYPETERWIAANAKVLDAASIAAFNAGLLGYERDEERAAEARARFGIDDPTLRRVTVLNDLDDWQTVHDWLVAHQGETLETMIPGVSSSSAGVLGAKHLPRLWIKALYKRVGVLPDDYNTGCGFDGFAAKTLGLDLDAAIAFIHAELPTEQAFERFVAEHVELDAEKLAPYNAAITGRQKSDEKSAAERAESGFADLSFTEVVMCNDALDWKALHDFVLARRSVGAVGAGAAAAAS